MKNFQQRVLNWVCQAFGVTKANDKYIRVYRFMEEAIELGQSLGMTKDEMQHQLDYVYNRAVGEPAQEVGGLMICLAQLCNLHDLSINNCAEIEYNRINDSEVIAKIREKEIGKLNRDNIAKWAVKGEMVGNNCNSSTGDQIQYVTFELFVYNTNQPSVLTIHKNNKDYNIPSDYNFPYFDNNNIFKNKVLDLLVNNETVASTNKYSNPLLPLIPYHALKEFVKNNPMDFYKIAIDSNGNAIKDDDGFAIIIKG